MFGMRRDVVVGCKSMMVAKEESNLIILLASSEHETNVEDLAHESGELGCAYDLRDDDVHPNGSVCGRVRRRDDERKCCELWTQFLDHAVHVVHRPFNVDKRLRRHVESGSNHVVEIEVEARRGGGLTTNLDDGRRVVMNLVSGKPRPSLGYDSMKSRKNLLDIDDLCKAPVHEGPVTGSFCRCAVHAPIHEPAV